MSALSVAAEMAWKVAGAEAARGRHSQIDNPLLLVGLCSLEKLLSAEGEQVLAPQAAQAVRREADRVEAALARAGLEAAPLRRLLRDRQGRGTYDHGDGPVSRSPACKETFYRAALLASGTEVTCLHLLAALAQDPDPAVSRPLRELGARLDTLKEQALLIAREAPVPSDEKGRETVAPKATPHLDRYGRDLTALAARGEGPPVMGRRAELVRVLQTLARTTRNCPVLVGEPGVGKRAIVEALAARAADGKDAVLAGRRIVELTSAALLGERGELLDEAIAHPEVILFLEDLPALIQSFKPALTRGALQLIATVTVEEYRRHLESDPVLDECFLKVPVEEPSREETLEVLRALGPRWEKQHRLEIDEEALQAAVDLSLRFDPDHRLPGKAIELVEGAAARTRTPDRVTERTVARVLAEKLSLPVELVAEALPGADRARVLDLEGHLRARIVGQEDAIARFCRRLRLVHGSTRDPRRPRAVMLFLGPTGVGKTATARLVASHLFGGPDAMARFDMSEFTDEDGVARLVGVREGSPGPEEEGRLVRRLRSRPYGVVLLDAVEKAHPRVFDLFLQLFDSGKLASGRGRTVDARDTLFILSSNLGASAAGERAEEATLEEVRRFFRPELLSRIDEQVVFRALGPEDAARIVKPILEEFVGAIRRQHGVVLTVEPAAEAFIAQAGFDPAHGVRDVPRAVERLVQAPLSSLILEGKIGKHPAWRWPTTRAGST